MLVPLVFCSMAAAQSYALYYDIMHIPTREGNWFTKLKYLTVLFMVVNTVYLLLSSLHLILSHLSGKCAKSRLVSFLDVLYASVILPSGLSVCILFWGIYYVDRELVHPEALDAIIPQWMNHLMHSTPVLFILVDTLVVPHKLPSRLSGAIIHSFIMLAYIVSLCVWQRNQGYWAYPFMDLLSDNQRIVFFVATMAFSLTLFFMGYTINSFIGKNGSLSKLITCSKQTINPPGTTKKYRKPKKKLRVD